MNIVFRTDASQQIGSGHVMRCLTLADELRQRGAEVMFICREHPGNLIGLIEGKGYPVVRLPLPGAEYVAVPGDVAHAPLLGVPWGIDAAETAVALEGKQLHWLIVDHYALDRRWEQMLRNLVGKILVIDDIADRCHDCDLLLDQNMYQGMASRYDALVPVNCTKLLGPRYALLRPEFANTRKSLRNRDGVIRRVLVFFGGMDPTNETYKAMLALAGIIDRQFAVDVVVGEANMQQDQIRNFCAGHDGFHFYRQVANLAELMAAADLAIGAGGSTTWERCSIGLPSIVSVLAENQKELAENGARIGLFLNLGEGHAVSAEKLGDLMKCLLFLPETLQHFSVNCLATVDAKGVNRVASHLFPVQVTLRRASLDDSDSIYEWRNAEETRRYIFNDAIIPIETHREWYRNAINNPERVLLIGEVDNKPAGVLRYDLKGSEALVSVYLVPGGQGQGVGSQLLRCGSDWIRAQYPHIKVINAEIFKENVASLRAFESAGYKEHHLIFQDIM